ncbi:MAG TPA: nucleoside 2-deoxyribosyltransferase domain-containing protein [Pirellulales bacterium]
MGSFMHVVYSDQPVRFIGPSIFLAGPTPRRESVPSWRPEALRLLEQFAFEGTVFVPEHAEPALGYDFLTQVEWEFAALERADAILFWIPRDAVDLPGFTTNVEFGRYVGSGRAVYGRPDDRPHNAYLDWLYEKLNAKPPLRDFREAVRAAIARACAEATR